MIAKIAVSAAVFAMDKPFSYAVPKDMDLQPGQRVTVPFGRNNRRVEGVILSLEEGEDRELKSVDRALDETPVLSGTMLRLAAFLRQRYFCTFYDAVKTMLPAGLWFTAKDRYTITESGQDYGNLAKRNPDAVAVMEQIVTLGGAADYADLRTVFAEEGKLQDALRYLLKKGLLTSQTNLLRKVGDRTEKIVTLAAAPEEADAYAARHACSAPLQAEVLRLLCAVGSAGAKEVSYFTGASMATLRRLEKLGYLAFSEREVLRRVEPDASYPTEELILSAGQKTAYEGLLAQMERRRGLALRRHRQRQDRRLCPSDPGLPGPGQKRHSSGAGNRPDAPASGPDDLPFRRPGCGAPQRSADGGAVRRMEADPLRKGHGGGGDPLCGLCACDRSGPHHTGRRTGTHL